MGNVTMHAHKIKVTSITVKIKKTFEGCKPKPLANVIAGNSSLAHACLLDAGNLHIVCIV